MPAPSILSSLISTPHSRSTRATPGTRFHLRLLFARHNVFLAYVVSVREDAPSSHLHFSLGVLLRRIRLLTRRPGRTSRNLTMQSIEEMEGILGDVTSQWDPKNDLQGHRRTTRTLTLGIGGTDFPMVRPRRTTSDRGVPGGYPQPPPFREFCGAEATRKQARK